MKKSSQYLMLVLLLTFWTLFLSIFLVLLMKVFFLSFMLMLIIDVNVYANVGFKVDDT